MNSTSVNSSKTSKEVKLNNIKVVGGPLNIVEKGKDYSIEMNPEYLIDFSTPMMDLAKSVGTFTKNGNTRVDNATGTKYVKSANGKIKVVKSQERDVR